MVRTGDRIVSNLQRSRKLSLGNFHAVEPGFPLEMLNHCFHSGVAGGTRHGACKSLAGSLVVGLGRQTVGERGKGLA